MSAILNKSKQVTGTPKAKTPKSNKANTSVGNNASKKRSLSPNNATPAAKSPKLEKAGGPKTPNASNNSAKKQKKKNTESTPRTPKANPKLEMKHTKKVEKRIAAKSHFNSMLDKCTAGDEEALKLVLQKIQELEQKPDKSKTAIRKLRTLRKRANLENAVVTPTEGKKKISKQTTKVILQAKDDEESEESSDMETDTPDVSEQKLSDEADSDDEEEEADSDDEGAEESDDEGEEESDGEADSDDESNEKGDVGSDSDDESDSNEDEVPLEVSSKSKVVAKDLSKKNKNPATKNQAVAIGKEKTDGKKETKYVMYVGNLDFTTKEEDIKGHFKLKDSITKIRFHLEFPAKQPTGNAFIEFKDSDSYEAALKFHQTILKNRRIICLYTNNGANTKEIMALLNKHKKGNTPNKQGGNFQNKQGGNFQNKQGGNFQNKQGGNFQNRQGGNFQNKQGGNFQNRSGGNFQNRPGGNFQNKPGGNFQNKQGGNFQNRGGNNFQKRPGQNFNKGSNVQENKANKRITFGDE